MTPPARARADVITVRTLLEHVPPDEVLGVGICTFVEADFTGSAQSNAGPAHTTHSPIDWVAA